MIGPGDELQRHGKRVGPSPAHLQHGQPPAGRCVIDDQLGGHIVHLHPSCLLRHPATLCTAVSRVTAGQARCHPGHVKGLVRDQPGQGRRQPQEALSGDGGTQVPRDQRLSDRSSWPSDGERLTGHGLHTAHGLRAWTLASPAASRHDGCPVSCEICPAMVVTGLCSAPGRGRPSRADAQRDEMVTWRRCSMAVRRAVGSVHG